MLGSWRKTCSSIVRAAPEFLLIHFRNLQGVFWLVYYNVFACDIVYFLVIRLVLFWEQNTQMKQKPFIPSKMQGKIFNLMHVTRSITFEILLYLQLNYCILKFREVTDIDNGGTESRRSTSTWYTKTKDGVVTHRCTTEEPIQLFTTFITSNGS